MELISSQNRTISPQDHQMEPHENHKNIDFETRKNAPMTCIKNTQFFCYVRDLYPPIAVNNYNSDLQIHGKVYLRSQRAGTLFISRQNMPNTSCIKRIEAQRNLIFFQIYPTHKVNRFPKNT